MGTEGDVAPHELFEVFRETIIRWLDRARHLTPGEGFELGVLVTRLEAELRAEDGADLVARRLALIGEVQLSLADVHAPEALIAAAGHLKGRPPAPSRPARPSASPLTLMEFPVPDAPVPRASGPKFGIGARGSMAEEETPAPVLAKPPVVERLRAVPSGPAAATTAEPWKRVPLKRLARAVPSARMVVDPIDQPGPSFEISDFNSKQ